MTDKMTPHVTDNDRRLAHEWAKSVESTTNPWSDRTLAAARVILDAVPTPPTPTLASMSPEERRDCQWMQADVEGLITGRWLILNPYDEDGDVEVVLESGRKEYISPERVTPRPDLPGMEWPGDKKPALAPPPALPEGWRLADHKDHGRVVVTVPEPYRDGYVYYVRSNDRIPARFSGECRPAAELTFLDADQGADTSDAVPENTLAVGSVWDDADALARACKESGRDQIVVADCDGDVTTWGSRSDWWETGLPAYGFDPYTIVHIGKKADQ